MSQGLRVIRPLCSAWPMTMTVVLILGAVVVAVVVLVLRRNF